LVLLLVSYSLVLLLVSYSLVSGVRRGS